MSQQFDVGCIPITLSATVAQFLRVTMAGAVATATTEAIGVATRQGVSGDIVNVDTLNKPGTVRMVASGAISANARVYGAAAGKITATQATGAFLQGIAREAATADGDEIEVYPIQGEVPKA